MAESCLMDQATMSEFREFDGRLNSLEGRMGAVERTLETHGALLLEIKGVVTEERASKGPGYSEIIRTVSSLATTAAIVAALLIYVATSVMNVPITSLSEKQSTLMQTMKPLSELVVDMAVAKQKILDIERRMASDEFQRGWRPVVADTNGRPPMR